MRVLIVDDEVDSLESFSAICRIWGHEVETVGQPTEAVAAALEHQADVVLLDLMMPEMDGCEVARRMRQQARLDRTFLVAVTGHGMPDEIFQDGFDAYLFKPVEPQDLKRFLEKRPYPAPRPRR